MANLVRATSPKRKQGNKLPSLAHRAGGGGRALPSHGHAGCVWKEVFAATQQGSDTVEFRWVALITLWTILVGPIFDQAPRANPRPTQVPTKAKAIDPSAPR